MNTYQVTQTIKQQFDGVEAESLQEAQAKIADLKPTRILDQHAQVVMTSKPVPPAP